MEAGVSEHLDPEVVRQNLPVPRWEVTKMIADAIKQYDQGVGVRLKNIEDLLLQLTGMGKVVKWAAGLAALGSGIYGFARLFHP